MGFIKVLFQVLFHFYSKPELKIYKGFVSGNHERFTMSQMFGLMKVMYQVIMKVLQ